MRVYAQENFNLQYEVSAMAAQQHIQRLRGDTSKNDGYTGLAGELTVNTDSSSLRIHNGSKVGGFGTIDAAHYNALPTSVPNDLRTGAHVTVGTGRLDGGTSTTAASLAGNGLVAQANTLAVDFNNLDSKYVAINGAGTIDCAHYDTLPATVPNELRTGAFVTVGNGKLQ